MIRCNVALLFPESANVTFRFELPAFLPLRGDALPSNTDNPTNAGRRSSERQMLALAPQGGQRGRKATGKEIRCKVMRLTNTGRNMNHPQQAGKEGQTHCDTYFVINYYLNILIF